MTPPSPLPKCTTGKTIFGSEDAACRAARRRPVKIRMRAYFCDQCHAWHLTSAKARKKIKR